MKIVVLAPVHRFDDIRVFRKEAATLAGAGHEVVLYARTPDGHPLVQQGVSVRPVRYSSRWQRFALLPVVAANAVRERADVYHLHNPDTLPIALLLKALGRRVVYDTHEDFRTEILLRGWLPRPLRRTAAAAVSAAEKAAGRICDAVIVTQEQLRERIPGAVLIGNPPLVDADETAAALRRRELRRPRTQLVLGYLGGISNDRGLSRMLDLVAAMARLHPTRLMLIGYPVNDDALQRAQQSPQWALVDHLGELAQDDAFRRLEDADTGLILFEDTASHRFIDPNKIYEYMALGLPFVATGFADWVRRIGPAGAGVFLPPGQDATASAQTVLEFLSDPAAVARAGRNGAEYVLERVSWQALGAPALLAIYRRILSRADQSGEADPVHRGG